MLVLTACTGSQDTRPRDPPIPDLASSEAIREPLAFGEPGRASEAHRDVVIEITDQSRFEPDSLKIRTGVTVNFLVVNDSDQPHEFFLGDQEAQGEHQAQMREQEEGRTPEPADGPNSIGLFPGETTVFTWKFTQPGLVVFACHVRDHYQAGMVGEILVTE